MDELTQTSGPVDILCKHVGDETDIAVIRGINDFGLRIEAEDGRHGSKDLLVGDAHVVGDIGQDSRLEETRTYSLRTPKSVDGLKTVYTGSPTQIRASLASKRHLGAFANSIINQGCHFVHRRRPNQGSMGICWLMAGSNPEALSSLRQAPGKLLIDFILHEDAAGTDAGLSTALELGRHCFLDDQVHIRVIEDDEGALPPSSKLIFLIVPLDCDINSRPTGVDLVKEIFRITLDLQSSSPICGVLSSAVTMLITLGGTPARVASTANAFAENGVSPGDFNTTVQPAASAGAILRVTMPAGKFHL